MADLSLEILLKMLADTHGADAVSDALNKVKAQTGDTASETANLTEKTASFTEEAGNAGNALQGLHISHRALHQMMHILGHETVPQLGRALGGLRFGPLAGSILAAGFAFEYFKEKLKAWNEEMDKAAEKAADPTFLEGIRAKQTALEQASSAADAYAAKLAATLAGEQSVTVELTSQLALMKAIAAAKGEQARAEESAAAAAIRAQEARGQITPEVAAERQAALAITSAGRARAEKRSQEETEAVAKANALQTAEDQQANLVANAKALTRTYTDEEARRKQVQTDFGDGAFDKKKKDADEVSRKTEAAYMKAGGGELEEWQTRLQGPLSVLGRQSAESEVARLKRELPGTQEAKDYELARTNQELLKKGRSQFESDQKSTPAFEDLGRQAATAREAADKNTTAISTLTGELKRLTDVLAISQNEIKAAREKASSEFEASVGLHKNDFGYNEEAERFRFNQKLNSGAFDHTTENATTQAERDKATSEYATNVGESNKKFIDADKKAEVTGDKEKMEAALSASHAHGKALVTAAMEAHRSGHAELVGVVETALRDLRVENSALKKRIDSIGK